MNNVRRKTLSEISAQLSALHSALAEIIHEEQDYLDNMPDAFQQGERGQETEETLLMLDEAMNDLQNVIDTIAFTK